MAIASFKDQGTQDVFDRLDTRAARKSCPRSIWNVARRKLDQINQSASVEDLRVPPGNRLEELGGKRAGQHSIRINDQYRLCFVWTEGGAEGVEIADYHK